MLNRRETAVVRALSSSLVARHLNVRDLALLATANGHGTLYSPQTHAIVAYNFGSHVRPDVAPVQVASNGHETVASFLARGGHITKGAPKVAKGASLVSVMKSGTTKVVTSRG